MKIRFISTLAISGLISVATLPIASAVTPTLSATLKAQLIYIIQEEKLARDSYAAIAKFNTSNKFKNITPSEQSHIDALATILKTYGIKNPITGLKAGVFVDKKLTALYKTVMDKAALSAADAIAVGVLIEETDIADINVMAKNVTQADIKLVLANLLKGSKNHLAAFSR